MPPSLRPPLPRSTADPARLQSLRQRALVRMAQDEHSGNNLTRRSSLQRFALIAAAATPVVHRLLRGQAAFAATPRTNAPQYGAPPMYHPPPAPPYPDYTDAMPKPVHALPATRAMLGSLQNWSASTVEFLGGGTGGWGYSAYESAAWSILYAMPGSKPFPFTAVVNNPSKIIYFVHGNHDFYISDKSGIYAASVGKGVLIVRHSLFQFPGTAPDIAAAITAFAANVDDKQIRQEESRFDSIDITSGIPFEFWNTTGSTQLPTISMVYPETNGAYIRLLSPNGEFTATISVDFKDKKVTRTTLNDKLVYGPK